MSLPFDLKDCYIVQSNRMTTKDNILDRIHPDTNIDDLLKGDGEEGGAFGLNTFQM